ncbi:MAG: hypothetical protein KDJ77_08225 [Rhodobiaceae bacterium]|nr:hypothetical protein [Rhodobiaceae bacterium]
MSEKLTEKEILMKRLREDREIAELRAEIAEAKLRAERARRELSELSNIKTTK